MSHSPNVRRVDDGLDDSSIRGHDGENHTGKKHEGQFVHVPTGRRIIRVCTCVCEYACVRAYLLHTHKHYQRHQEQAACPIDTHIVGHHAIILFKQCCCWNDVNLAVWRRQKTE